MDGEFEGHATVELPKRTSCPSVVLRDGRTLVYVDDGKKLKKYDR
jgi:hypothetical protein